MNPVRSWNCAIVAITVFFAAFLACALSFIAGWHPAFTGRAAGPFGAAAVICGFWLHWAGSRLGPLEQEPDEDDPEAGEP